MSEKSAKIVGSNPAPPGPAVHAGVSEAIVDAALVAVGQNRVGLGRLLEAFFGLVIVRIAIGMVLQRELAVRALDLLVRRLTLDAEDFVVVALGHHFSLLAGPRLREASADRRSLGGGWSRLARAAGARFPVSYSTPLATFTIAGRISRSPSM